MSIAKLDPMTMVHRSLVKDGSKMESREESEVPKPKWRDKKAAETLIGLIEGLRIKPDSSASGRSIYVLKGGQVEFYDASRIRNYFALLREYVKFNEEVPFPLRENFISEAIAKAGAQGEPIAKKISDFIRHQEKEYLSQDSSFYTLASKITLVGLESTRTFSTGNATIKIRKDLPRKIAKHYDFDQAKSASPDHEGADFAWVLVEVKERCIYSAAATALKELDYWIALLNITLNHNLSRESFGRPEPINRLRKHHYHSLHLPSGEKATRDYWYEVRHPSNGNVLFYDDSLKDLFAHQRKLHKLIIKCGQKNFFSKIFSRYCDALETNDLNKSFLELWGVLEAITQTKNSSYETTIQRAKFIYAENSMEMVDLKLRVLREKRNMVIHDGEGILDGERFIFILLAIIHENIRIQMAFYNKGYTPSDYLRLVELPALKNDARQMESDLLEKKTT